MYERYVEESGKRKKTVKVGHKVVSKLEAVVGSDTVQHAKRPKLQHQDDDVDVDYV